MFSAAVIVCGLFLVVLESTLLVRIPAWFGRPDLVFILVTWLALRFDGHREMFLVLALGLLLDAASGVGHGLYPAAYLAVFVIVRLAASSLNLERGGHPTLLIVVAYLLFFAAAWVVSTIQGQSELIPWRRAIPEIAALTIISYPLTHLFDRGLAPLADRDRMRRLFQRRRRRNRYL